MPTEEMFRAALADHVAPIDPDLDLELSRLVRHSAKRRCQRLLGGIVAATVAVVVGLAWVQGGRPSTLPADEPTPTPSPPSEAVPIEPGAFTGAFLDAAPDAPRPRIVVPPGWFQRDGWQLTPEPEDSSRAVEFWTIYGVNNATACSWEPEAPGPDARDLAEAFSDSHVMTVAPATGSLAPGLSPEDRGLTPTILDGYAGWFGQVSLVKGCSSIYGFQGPVDLWRAFGGQANTVEHADTSRLWILEIEGHTLVVVASHRAGDRPAQVRELTEMVESLTFAPPE